MTQNITVKGLSVNVMWFSNGRTDCSNNGVTSPKNCPSGRAILIWDAKADFKNGEDSPKIFEPREDEPVLKVEEFHGRLRAVPCKPDGTKKPGWFMASGNFVWTSDSRFPWDYPIPVHDRQE